MKTFLTCFCLFLWGIVSITPAKAQNYEQKRKKILEQQEHTRFEIEKLNQLIEKYTQRLNKAKQKYSERFEAYQDLKRSLAVQKKKLEKLREKQEQIETEIAVTENKLAKKKEKLEKLIESYKKTLRYLYKHGRTSRMALILSAESLNQMIVRNYYLKKFETYREKQVAQIKQTQQELKQSKKQLKAAHKKNKDVLAEIKQEKQKLAAKKQRQEQNIRLLRQNREKIQAKLQETQQQKQELNQTLTELIEREEELREARIARIKKREAARKQKLAEAKKIKNEAVRKRKVEKYDTPVHPTGFIGEERLAEISESFAAHKGELPWPVESHTVSKHFGRYRHPVYGTYTKNLGIEIVTEANAPVRVVEDGYVFAVQPITGYGNVVFVSHGEYKTAYGNLGRITVQKNSILKAGDIVGFSGSGNGEGTTTVFFMLRGEDENMDPEEWLK